MRLNTINHNVHKSRKTTKKERASYLYADLLERATPLPENVKNKIVVHRSVYVNFIFIQNKLHLGAPKQPPPTPLSTRLITR